MLLWIKLSRINLSLADRHLIKSSVEFAFSSYVFQIINFGMTLILVRLLVPEYFGLFALLMALREFLYALFGFSTPMYFILSDGKQADFNMSLNLSILSAIGLIFAGAFIFLWLQSTEKSEIAVPLLLLCFCQGISNIAAIFLAPIERETQYLKLSLIRNIAATLSLAICVIIAFIWPSFWALVFRELMLSLILLFAGIRFCKLGISFQFNRNLMLDAVRTGYQITLSRAAEILFYRAPEIFISRFFGLAQTGHFFQSRNFLMLVLKIPNTILDQTLFSTFAKMNRTDGTNKTYVFLLVLILSRMMMLVSLSVTFLGPMIFTFFYGENWHLASKLIPDLAWFVFFAALFNFAQAYCYSNKAQMLVFISYAVGIFTFCLFGIYAVKQSDLSLIAWGLTLSMGAACIPIYFWGKIFDHPIKYIRVFWLPALTSLYIFIPFNSGIFNPLILVAGLILAALCVSIFEISRESRYFSTKSP